MTLRRLIQFVTINLVILLMTCQNGNGLLQLYLPHHGSIGKMTTSCGDGDDHYFSRFDLKHEKECHSTLKQKNTTTTKDN